MAAAGRPARVRPRRCRGARPAAGTRRGKGGRGPRSAPWRAGGPAGRAAAGAGAVGGGLFAWRREARPSAGSCDRSAPVSGGLGRFLWWTTLVQPRGRCWLAGPAPLLSSHTRGVPAPGGLCLEPCPSCSPPLVSGAAPPLAGFSLNPPACAAGSPVPWREGTRVKGFWAVRFASRLSRDRPCPCGAGCGGSSARDKGR